MPARCTVINASKVHCQQKHGLCVSACTICNPKAFCGNAPHDQSLEQHQACMARALQALSVNDPGGKFGRAQGLPAQ